MTGPAPRSGLIGFDEAFAIVAECACPLGIEQVPLDLAAGRVLAEPVVAQIDSPRSDVSAMDGYAVRERDLPRVRRVGTSWPGAGFGRALGTGECVRIFTGAPVPDGADRVIVQEIVRADGDFILVQGEASDRYIRRRGSDFASGDRLIEAGRLIDARALVAAAGADLDSLAVRQRPKVAILGTGDELVEPGRARATAASIPDSLSLGLAAFVQGWGGGILSCGRVEDDPDAIQAAAGQALQSCDLVVIAGGASVGEKDHSKAVFARLGLELLFSKVAIKPGKPVWFGRAQGRIVLGLPGNPTSAMVVARLLLAPLLAGLNARDPAVAAQWRPARVSADLGPCGDRETFLRARGKGQEVEPLPNQDSGGQLALVAADHLIRRPPGSPPAKAGDEVQVIDF